MFDRYPVSPRSPDVHVHNKIEQKPHDAADAARLYGELERKAESAVAGATIERLGANNEILVARIDSDHDYLRDKLMVRLLFSINGVKYDLRVDANREGMQRDVCRVMAEAVTEKLFRHLLFGKPTTVEPRTEGSQS